MKGLVDSLLWLSKAAVQDRQGTDDKVRLCVCVCVCVSICLYIIRMYMYIDLWVVIYVHA